MRPYAVQLCLIVMVVVQAIGLAAAAGEKEAAPQSGFPSLVQSIRFQGKIMVCGQEIPYHQPEIRERLEKEVMLALWNRPQVILWLKRANRYFPHIEKILEEAGLPADMKYVPVVESALRAHAQSGKGAVGYWQFLRGTARNYGLRVDDQVDERRNIFKSTRAAALYMKTLKEAFGSYLLALAAYNMGEFGLAAEIEIQESQSFFSLYLPLETQRYVFKIAAAKLIMENPGAFGFHLQAQDLYPLFAYSEIRFNMSRKTPLTLISSAAGISFKTLKDYNPELRGYDLAPGKMVVLVPKGKEKGFKERFASLHKDWKKTDRIQYHIVRSGESLTGIAEAYDISLTSLLRLNQLSYGKVIHPGDRIRVR